MGRAVGIDLGTTNSCIATLEGGQPTVIVNAEGARTTPSVVAFSKSGEILVGEVAKRQAVTNVDRTISSVKRHMGTDWTVEIDGKKWTPQEISAQVLMKLKRDAEAYLGEPVTDAVITCPAYINDAQPQATKDAGTIAGQNVLRIINEPTTAALAYGLEKGKEDERILVFDLGGGTFDVSLLEIGKDDDGFSTIQVQATNGDNHLGGDDWDQKIIDWLVGEVKNKYGVDLSKDKIALQRLKEAAEQAKKELSSSTSTSISMQYLAMTPDGTPVHLDETLTRAHFEEMTSDLLGRCRTPFNNVLHDAGISVSDIDHVVLVGGSTRMPAVKELVKELTGGKEANQSVNPDEVVAVGAAVQAGDIKYRDVNGAGVVNTFDKVAIGYTLVPEINYGFGASLKWKGIDVSVFFSGVGHVPRIIQGQNLFGASSTILRMGQIFEDVAKTRWTLDNQNPNAPYPRLSLNKVDNNQQLSTYWQRDMSFLRQKDAEIGYTLPESMTKKWGLSKIRFYIHGKNLVTFSDFKLWDPEVNANYGNVYPLIRTFAIGANVNF